MFQMMIDVVPDAADVVVDVVFHGGSSGNTDVIPERNLKNGLERNLRMPLELPILLSNRFVPKLKG